MNLVKDNVRAIRLAKGIMATHVGRALGYTSAAGYYHLEKGASSLGVEELKVIANVLGEPVGVFFDQESTESVIQRIRSGEIARNGRNRPGQDEAPVQATHKDS